MASDDDNATSAADSQALSMAQGQTLAQSDSDGVAPCPAHNHWIEIVLQDDSGESIANEEYVIDAPDGSKLRGTLNGDGFARVEGLKPGTCQVSFPNLYKRLGPHYING